MKIPGLPLIATHIIGWILFQGLPLVFLLSMTGSTVERVFSSTAYWLFCSYYIGVFYLHQYFLLPRLYRGGKKTGYILSMAVLLASAVYLRPFDHMTFRQRELRFGNMRENRVRPPDGYRPQMSPRGERFEGPRKFRMDIIGIFLLLLVIMFGIAIDISRRSRLAEQRAAQAEADRANAELSFLKAQINPHFLFNTLNNIYSMAVTGHRHTADMLMKLSNIMRYVTDDVNSDFVPLQNEVDCISDYIDLQQLRLGQKTTLQYAVNGDTDNRLIAPLLLMTFVENVFKYGISKQEASELTIRLDIEAGRICFYTANRVFPMQRRDDRTGIGIANTRKRLAHLYPSGHSLQIKEENDLFIAELCLNA
ncbi:sensor histidine kinase [Sediminibacterium soli]|uniref:sensor histidine kinase n=1 Tax=Sediminibacterium soli TaxID=2698829 RepID=UPI00137A986D|nr:sensor histidine kinase [Sediminibacterium soli]NCI48262.1 hypothetical protein [Sediminibacterium soli]